MIGVGAEAFYPRGGKPLSLHSAVAKCIGIAILSGRYVPGQLLDAEIALSGKVSVSLATFRAAVRILAAKGLVLSKPKVGTKVAEKSKWHILDPDVLAWMFEIDPDVEMLNCLFELRDLVESAAAGHAALRRTAADLNTMRTALEVMKQHTLKTEAGRQADRNFHEALMRSTRNPFIISLVETFGTVIAMTVTYKYKMRPLRRDPFLDHLKVFEAIAERNSTNARQAMHDLIRNARLDMPLSISPQRQAGAAKILTS